MSLYLIIGILTALAAFIGTNNRFEKPAYVISFSMLAAFLIFRYGQGTDWLSYNYIFSMAPKELDFGSVFYTDAIHSEIGWKLINNIWKILGLEFTHLSIAVSVLEMLLLASFINKNSKNRALSLFVSFPVVYLTYFFSALRQGLVIAIFLGLMIDIFERGKGALYFLATLFCASLHSLSWIFLIPYLFRHLPMRSLPLLFVSSGALGLCLIPLFPIIIKYLGMDYASADISIVALLYRAVMASIVFMLYSSAKKRVSNISGLDALIRIYVIGLCVYMIFMGNELYASRLASPFLAVEMALIPALALLGDKHSSRLLLIVICAACVVMTLKNIDSYISQGNYLPDVSIMNYPYISILNKEEIYLVSRSPYLIYLN